MASFSKASQGVLRAFKPWLGIPESPTGHDEDDSDGDDGSIWRLPSQATTLVGSEASAGSNPSGSKQHRSATETDYKGWSRSLRALAAHFYAEENTKPSGPSDDSVPRTPEKRVRPSPRKPLPWSKSSIRSRGGADVGNFNANGTPVSDNGDPKPKPIAQTTAPVLNVAIPKFSLAVDTEDQSMLADPNLLKAYRSKQSRISEPLAQSAENHPASSLPKQESEQVLRKIDWKFPVAGNPNDAYHELLQGPRGSSETKVSAKASSSNDSDVEDNDEDGEYSGAGLLELHAAAKGKAPLHPDSHTEKPSPGPPNGESTERTIPLSHYLKTPSPPSKGHSMLRKSQSIRKGLDRLQHTLTGSFKGRPGLKPRAPSYASDDADAENSEGSPHHPSMGSKYEWQERRIERNRRYAEAVADRPPTEDDSESGESLQLSRSPTRKPMDSHHKGGSLTGVGVHDAGQTPRTNDLGYDVEANERRNADELSVKNLRYAIEAIDRPSASELEDCEGTAVVEPHMMIAMPDSQDPYEAALLAAGLQAERRHSWIPTLESLCEHDAAAAAAAAGNVASVLVRLDGVYGRDIIKHEDLHGTGMWAPKQIHVGSEDELKVFNSFASSSDAGSEGENGDVGVGAVGYFGHELMGSMDDSRDKKKAGDTAQEGNKIFVDSGASACGSDGVSSQDDTISID